LRASACATAPARYPFPFSTRTARPATYSLSLHDALPISHARAACRSALGAPAPHPRARRQPLLDREHPPAQARVSVDTRDLRALDRKSTRLNSSHEWISYAVFCLKKTTTQRQAELAHRVH